MYVRIISIGERRYREKSAFLKSQKQIKLREMVLYEFAVIFFLLVPFLNLLKVYCGIHIKKTPTVISKPFSSMTHFYMESEKCGKKDGATKNVHVSRLFS